MLHIDYHNKKLTMILIEPNTENYQESNFRAMKHKYIAFNLCRD